MRTRSTLALSTLGILSCSPTSGGRLAEPQEVIGLALRIEKPTILKARLVDSLELADLEKCALKGGAILLIENIPRHVGHKHYAVTLVANSSTCPFSEGFLYGPHIGYTSSSDEEPVTPSEPDKPLEPEEPVEPPPIRPAPEEPVEPPPIDPIDPFEPIEPPPVPLPANDPNERPVTNPMAFTLTSQVDTLFKRQARQSRELPASDLCGVAAHTTLRLESLPEAMGGPHFKVTITDPSFRCSFRTGYFYGPHVGLQSIRIPAPPARRPTEQRAGQRIFAKAQAWVGKSFSGGGAADTMLFVRKVLTDACRAQFQSLETKNPWDLSVLGPDEPLGPSYANSLAGEEIGTKLRLEELKAGDLVFLRNTYGNWAEGVITLVGIATGDGSTHIYRGSAPMIKRAPIDARHFSGGLRIKPSLCP